MTIITPETPEAAWLARFLEPTLVSAAPYKIDTPKVTIKLDQNESPYDWPRALKEKIAARLVDRAWNRYPSAFADDLAEKVARYAGVKSNAVLLGPGSNYLCSLVLSVFSKGVVKGRGGKVVVARPSFPLYESHCRYEGIPYEPWHLDTELEYDVKALPKLTPGSVVIFASPNNPVGNALPKATFARLLGENPETLFVADEAYFEYTSEQYTDLFGKFSNMISIRTFSKTLGYAGVRLGYVVAAPEFLEPLRKLRLPYLLNHFTIAAAETILDDASTANYLAETRRNAITERERVYAGLSELAARGGFRVKGSEANFLLLRWREQATATKAYRHLIAQSILVRDVSAGPGLSGCLRATIGEAKDNDRLLAAFSTFLP